MLRRDASRYFLAPVPVPRGHNARLRAAPPLAAHGLTDAGYEVPASYRDLLRRLADAGVIDRELGARLGAAMGLRNLIAHRYGAVDWALIHQIAQHNLADLLACCTALAGDGEEPGTA